MASLADMLAGPALPPPPGVTVNPQHPAEDATSSTLGVVSFCFALSTVAMAIRFYTKAFISKSFLAEDWTALVAAVLYVPLFALLVVGVTEHKQALHMYDITMGEFWDSIKYLTIETIVNGVLLAFIKVSILLQYMSIFTSGTMSKRDYIWWTCWSMIVIIIVFYICSTFLWIFMCNPHEKAWMPWLPGTCAVGVSNIDMASVYFNVVTDLIILVVPQHRIWSLQMPLARKLRVSSVFAIAALAVVASAVRTYYTHIFFFHDPDMNWYIQAMIDCLSVEIVAAFISSCLPSLAKFFQTYKPGALSSGKTMYASGGSQGTRRTGKPYSTSAPTEHAEAGGSFPLVTKTTSTRVSTSEVDSV